jgi:hypothetical protein
MRRSEALRQLRSAGLCVVDFFCPWTLVLVGMYGMAGVIAGAVILFTGCNYDTTAVVVRTDPDCNATLSYTTYNGASFNVSWRLPSPCNGTHAVVVCYLHVRPWDAAPLLDQPIRAYPTGMGLLISGAICTSPVWGGIVGFVVAAAVYTLLQAWTLSKWLAAIVVALVWDGRPILRSAAVCDLEGHGVEGRPGQPGGCVGLALAPP